MTPQHSALIEPPLQVGPPAPIPRRWFILVALAVLGGLLTLGVLYEQSRDRSIRKLVDTSVDARFKATFDQIVQGQVEHGTRSEQNQECVKQMLAWLLASPHPRPGYTFTPTTFDRCDRAFTYSPPIIFPDPTPPATTTTRPRRTTSTTTTGTTRPSSTTAGTQPKPTTTTSCATVPTDGCAPPTTVPAP